VLHFVFKGVVCDYCCCYMVAVVFWPIARVLLRVAAKVAVYR